MASLLDFMNTPAGMGLLSAVAGGLAGARRSTPINNVGRGLLAGLEGYSNTQDEILKRQQMEQAQKMQDLQQQQLQGQITDQQSARDFYSPANIAKYSTSATPERTSLAAGPLFGQQALGLTPDFTPQVTPAKPAAFDTTGFAQGMLQSGNPQLAQQGLKTLQQAGPKVKNWNPVNIGGQVLYAPYMEDGTVGKPVPYSVAEKLHFADTGGAIQAADPFTGAPVGAALPKSQSPDSIASNNTQLRGQNLTNSLGWARLHQNGENALKIPVAYLDNNNQPIWGNLNDARGKPAANYNVNLQGAITQAKTEGTGRGTAATTLSATESSLPQLEATINQLSNLADKATFTVAGKARDAVARQLGAPTEGSIAREHYNNIVKDVLFPQLRATFGAQFTVKEGEALISTLGDPDKSPAEKKAALNAFIDQKKQTIDSLRRQTGKAPIFSNQTSMPQAVPGNSPANGAVSLDDYLKSQGH